LIEIEDENSSNSIIRRTRYLSFQAYQSLNNICYALSSNEEELFRVNVPNSKNMIHTPDIRFRLLDSFLLQEKNIGVIPPQGLPFASNLPYWR